MLHEARQRRSWLIFDVGQNMKITRACAQNADALTKVAFAAKRHWHYPESWMRRWEEALTITPAYVIENPTFVAVVEGEFVGFWAVQIEAGEAMLDYLWVLPPFMGKGVGRALFQHAEEVARASGAMRMRIVGDPHAEQFYSRMGAALYGHESASMDGEERFLPLLEKIL
jgi:predicted N-acetyltransferase YhbS